MVFTTERTIVRSPIIEDAKDIYNNYTQDSEVTKYLVWKPHTDIQQTLDWINFCIKIGLYRVFCGYNSRPPQKKSMAVL